MDLNTSGLAPAARSWVPVPNLIEHTALSSPNKWIGRDTHLCPGATRRTSRALCMLALRCCGKRAVTHPAAALPHLQNRGPSIVRVYHNSWSLRTSPSRSPPPLNACTVCVCHFGLKSRMGFAARRGVVAVVLAAIAALIVRVVGGSLAPVERAALVDLYSATAGQTWLRRDGWTTNATGDPCTDGWFGISCSGGSPNHVTCVVFFQIRLLNEHLFYASHVPCMPCATVRTRSLTLPGNTLMGTLPSTLTALSTLQ